jgi:hypothetical protein
MRKLTKKFETELEKIIEDQVFTKASGKFYGELQEFQGELLHKFENYARLCAKATAHEIIQTLKKHDK